MSILVSGKRKIDTELAMEKWIYNVLEILENKEDSLGVFENNELAY